MLPVERLGAFLDRLESQLKDRRRWAAKNKVSCFRIYDREEVGFPFLIDLYEEKFSWSVLTEKDEEELSDEILAAAAARLEVPVARMYLRLRRKQQGRDQYEKMDDQQEFSTVREGGLKFLINLTDYLDTGLFLDHRWTRSYVRDASAGMKVLNLFAYTGSFSVYAAHGGAFETTTVDLNPNYLEWAKKNMELNGFSGSRHRFLRRDVMEFLRTETTKAYDLIVLDPPTFSNSKKMDGTLDVQRDSAWLIERCLKLLNKDGLLFFSNNYQKFRLDPAIAKKAKVQEISSLTVPKDFRKGAHQSWLITHPLGPEVQLKNLDLGSSR